MNEIVLKAEETSANARIDKYIAENVENMTRSAVQKLIAEGCVTINGKIPDKNLKLKTGDEIKINLPEPEICEALPENIPLDIVYEDEDLLVVNKPRGMVVHPATGNYTGTLVNALMYHCGDRLSGINGVIRPGIVHRIDKDTSGLLIVAKNDFAHNILAEQIKEHSFTRKYQAVVVGNLKDDTGTVNAPVGRHQTDRKKMAVTLKNSRNAVTHYKVIARYNGYTHVELTLETGRTHQIRVHMAYIGHPVVGDPVYAPRRKNYGLSGQALHSRAITFVHPRTGETMHFECDLPDYYQDVLNSFKG